MSPTLEHSLLLKLTLARLNRDRQIPINYLKPKQSQCILAAASGKDLLGILPTGYGKSLIFEAIPIYLELVGKGNTKTIVMSPLNVIIEQQMAMFGKNAIRVQPDVLETSYEGVLEESGGRLDDPFLSKESKSNFREGRFKFLLGHPEDILAETTMEALLTAKWASNVSHVVIDEAHCAVTWSKDFRPKFRDIEHLRAIFPTATFIALTATASLKMRKDIIHILNMENPTVISAQVDRTNIRYSVKRRPSNAMGVETSYTSVFVPVLEELKAKGHDFPKTIIYTSLKWCGYGNDIGVRMLANGELSMAGVPEIAQFHAPLSAQAKKIVAEQMAEDGELRLLLATEAYGMGVDTPHIRQVIHAGPPCTLETYMQTTGRGGRDGADTEAVLYYNNEDLGKRTVTDEVRTFCRLESCRREYLSQYFGTETVFDGLLHRCCDNCTLVCDCDECNSSFLSEEAVKGPVDSHNDLRASIVLETLKQVFEEINAEEKHLMDPQLFSGLTLSLAKDISAHYELFTNLEFVRMNYFYLKQDFADVIFQVICACKNIIL